MKQIPLKPPQAESTRTQSTEEDYLRVARQLTDRFEREQGVSLLESPMDGVRWLANQRPVWSRPTWRRYKSAMVYWLRQVGEGEVADQLLAYDSAPCKLTSTETSAKKLKKIPHEDLVRLVTELIDRSDQVSRTPEDTRLWLLSGIATGLRPEEWRSASIEGDVLTVRNGKATNDRSFGPDRRLSLAAMSDEMRSIIADHVARVSGMSEDDFARYYSRVRIYLYRLNNSLWPRRERYICLYSGRHQFSANMKSSKASRAQVAASMGHGSTETAGEHYGRSVSGYSADIVAEITALPSNEDVQAVEAKNAFRQLQSHPDNQKKRRRRSKKLPKE